MVELELATPVINTCTATVSPLSWINAGTVSPKSGRSYESASKTEILLSFKPSLIENRL